MLSCNSNAQGSQHCIYGVVSRLGQTRNTASCASDCLLDIFLEALSVRWEEESTHFPTPCYAWRNSVFTSTVPTRHPPSYRQPHGCHIEIMRRGVWLPRKKDPTNDQPSLVLHHHRGCDGLHDEHHIWWRGRSTRHTSCASALRSVPVAARLSHSAWGASNNMSFTSPMLFLTEPAFDNGGFVGPTTVACAWTLSSWPCSWVGTKFDPQLLRRARLLVASIWPNRCCYAPRRIFQQGWFLGRGQPLDHRHWSAGLLNVSILQQNPCFCWPGGGLQHTCIRALWFPPFLSEWKRLDHNTISKRNALGFGLQCLGFGPLLRHVRPPKAQSSFPILASPTSIRRLSF